MHGLSAATFKPDICLYSSRIGFVPCFWLVSRRVFAQAAFSTAGHCRSWNACSQNTKITQMYSSCHMCHVSVFFLRVKHILKQLRCRHSKTRRFSPCRSLWRSAPDGMRNISDGEQRYKCTCESCRTVSACMPACRKGNALQLPFMTSYDFWCPQASKAIAERDRHAFFVCTFRQRPRA